jgi:hypothetical protein
MGRPGYRSLVSALVGVPLVETGAGSYDNAGEPPSQPSMSTTIPSTIYGEVGSLVVESGTDPELDFRSETEVDW